MMSTLAGFLSKELKQALRDPRMRILLFLAPIVQLVLFGVAISNDVKNIRLWVQFDSSDTVLQHVYERALASRWFLPAGADRNSDPFELLRAGKVDAAVIPPPGGLTRAIERGDADLQILVNATNVLQAQSIDSYLRNIITRVVAEDRQREPPEPPIRYDTRVLYNATLETSYFMVPGVMAMLMIINTMILTSMSISREKEMGTFEMLISAPVTVSEVVFGKTIPYAVLGMASFPLILGVAMIGFHVPMRGSLVMLTIASLAFVFTAVAIGTLISTFAQNQQQSMMGGFLFLFPAVLLSGLFFPIENMPLAMKWMAYVDPVTHYLALLRNIMLKGGELDFALQRIGILTLMALVSGYISFKRFHTTLQ
jgi:ABC-2 type transport system permease protein